MAKMHTSDEIELLTIGGEQYVRAGDVMPLMLKVIHVDRLRDEIAKREKEIERLRARLERIAVSPDDDIDHLRWLAKDAIMESW